MTLTLALAAIAALLALAAVAILVGGTAWGRGLVYGGALLICAMSGAAALFQLVGGAATPSATLPLGLPWLGAHFRMDALSAFFLVVVMALSRRACSRSVMAAMSTRPCACCRSIQCSSPA